MSPAKRSVLNLQAAGSIPVEHEEFEISIESENWQLVWDYDSNCIKRNIEGRKRPANYGALIQESLLVKHPGLIYSTTRQPRITQSQSKKNVPFIQFWGCCVKKNCEGKQCPTKYKLTLLHIPKPHELIILKVYKTGTRDHTTNEQSIPVSRQIKGPIRQLFSKTAGLSSPSITEGNLYRIADPWDLADGVRPIGLSVARTLKYESRQANFLSKEVMVDLDKRQQRLAVEFPELPAAGYLQEIGYLPFHLPMFNSMQLYTALKLARERQGLEIHIDATGSILSKLDIFRHKAFLYTIVVQGPDSDSTLSLLDFILDMHDWIRIRNRISSYLSYLNACQDNVGSEIRPIMRVTTDFSWALIKAVISAFNNYMSLGTYLNIVYKRTFNIPDDSVHASNFHRIGHLECIVTLCYAHIMKSFSMNLNRKAVSNKARRLALNSFADLIKCESHERFMVVFESFIWIFGSKYHSDELQNHVDRIKGDADFEMNEELDEDRQSWYTEWESDLVWEESPSKQKKPLKLFTGFYEDLIKTLHMFQETANAEKENPNPNEYFSEPVLNTFFIIYVPVIPLWAEFCFKFHGNYVTKTNGRSEGMFSYYKTHVLNNSRLAPGELVETLFQATITSYRKYYAMRQPIPLQDKPGSSTVRDKPHSKKDSQNLSTEGYGLQHSKKMKGFEKSGRFSVLRGNFHQGDTNRFSACQAGSQCTAIAAISLCYAFFNPIKNWSTADLDKVLILGDQFYTTKLELKVAGDYLSSDEVQGLIHSSVSLQISSSSLVLRIPNSSERSGMLLDGLSRFPRLKVLDVLLEEFMASDHTRCIITSSGYSYAIVKEQDFVFFIDSHSKNVQAQQDANGASIVLKIPSRIATDTVSEILHNAANNTTNISKLENSEVMNRFGISLAPFDIEISESNYPPDVDSSLQFQVPNQDVTTSNTSTTELLCGVCKQPCGGAHKCCKCGGYVHAICGTGDESDEGFGSLVTCANCSVPDTLTVSEVNEVGFHQSDTDVNIRSYARSGDQDLFPQGLQDICSVCKFATGDMNFCSVCFKFCHSTCCLLDDFNEELTCRNCLG